MTALSSISLSKGAKGMIANRFIIVDLPIRNDNRFVSVTTSLTATDMDIDLHLSDLITVVELFNHTDQLSLEV